MADLVVISSVVSLVINGAAIRDKMALESIGL